MSKHSRTLVAFVALCVALVGLVAGAASALARPLPPDYGSPPDQQQPMTVEHVSNGSPIWVFVVVAVAAAALSVIAALAAVRLRQARRSTAYA